MTLNLTIGSLFAGIGGLELGLERAGVGHTVWQVEREPYCQRVLAKHWPDAVRYDDVRTVGAHNLAPVDVICGGFPCQDITHVGTGAGLAGERSGLWVEYARIVRELRPRYVVVENAAALAFRGLGTVLGDLNVLGYDAEWSTLSACAVGAPHMRARLFLLAYANRERQQAVRREGIHDDAALRRRRVGARHLQAPPVAGRSARGPHWADPPGVDVLADGVPSRVDRLRALGNAVVPQVAEVVGRLIVAREAALSAERAA